MDKRQSVRLAAAVAIGELGGAAASPPIQSQLARLLTDEQKSVRQAAAWAIGELGGTAANPYLGQKALEALAPGVEDLRWSPIYGAVILRRKWMNALGDLESMVATPPLLKQLARWLADERQPGPRIAAAEAVRKLMAQRIRIF